MNKSYEDVCALAKATITGTPLQLEGEQDWKQLFRLTARAKLLPVTFKTISSAAGNYEIPEDILEHWRQETVARGFKQLYLFEALKELLLKARERDLQLVVFKGIALAALYPEPNMRYSCDSDVLVKRSEQGRAIALLEDLGYEMQEEHSKEHVPVYVKHLGITNIVIELHDCLWEDYEGKQAELLDSLRLDADDTLITQRFMGYEYLTLGINEHFIFQIYHIVKHLFFEGVSLRYLTDIALFVNKYNSQINWPEVREKLGILHYETFLDCILAIARDYLGMTAEVPGIGEVPEKLKDHLMEDMFGDRQFHSEKEQWETINFLSTYFMRTNVVKESKFSQKRKQLFPLPSELNEKYSYAKKCPLLLPVAWVHRIIYFIGYRNKAKQKGFDGSAVMKRSESRLDLMRELELMDTDKELKEQSGKK